MGSKAVDFTSPERPVGLSRSLAMLGTASSETSESVRARQLKGVLHAGGHEIVSGYGAGITALDLALKYRLSPPGNTSSYVDPGSINKRVILYDASGVTYSNMS